MTETRSNSEAESSDHVAHDNESLGPPSPGILERFQQRQSSTGTDQVVESSDTAHGQNVQAPVSFDSRCAEEKDEDGTISDANPHGTGPRLSENIRDEYHPTLPLIGVNLESRVGNALDQAVDGIAPVPMSHSMHFEKGAAGGCSSKWRGPCLEEHTAEDHAPLPISQRFDETKSKMHKNPTDIQSHGFMNSSISSMDESSFVTGQSISADAYTPQNTTNYNISDSWNFEPCTTLEATYNQQDDTSLVSQTHESMTAQNIDIRLPTRPALIEADIIIPEAFLVTNDALVREVASDEFADSQIPSARVVLPARYSVIIAGTNFHCGALAAMLILLSLVIGLPVGVTLGNLTLTIPTSSNHSAAASIKFDIERNVLRRNTTFSELDQYDSRNKALNWILLEDGMQVNASFSNLHQRYIMAMLRYEFDSISELDLPDWHSEKHECDWHGVFCLDGKVTELELGEFLLWTNLWKDPFNGPYRRICSQVGLNLTGSLSPEVSRLYFLQKLVLKVNSIEGTLPPEISDMVALKTLELNDNHFKGSVPSSIGNLTQLSQLDISNNQFTGSLPSSIKNLTALTRLDVSNNRITGSLPSSIGNVNKLTHLDVSYNQFTGSLTSSIGNLTKLTQLDLSNNDFTGILPSSIGNLTELTSVAISFNWLTGSLASSIENLNKLTYLDITANLFNGSLPFSIGKLNKLTHLEITSNQFTGTLPSSIWNLSKLTHLGMFFNHFTGTLSSSIGNLTELKVLDISNNQFIGSLPSSIGNLSDLTFLDVSVNDFTGTGLVKILCDLDESLVTFYFKDNNFTTYLNDEICNTFQFENVDVCA